jgi:hypothetical protein
MSDVFGYQGAYPVTPDRTRTLFGQTMGFGPTGTSERKTALSR